MHKKKNDTKSSIENNKQVTNYVKIDDVKGVSNDKSSKKNKIIEETKKTYASSTTQNNSKKSNSYFVKFEGIEGETSEKDFKRIYNKRKFSQQALKEKKTTRRRVIVAKSNIQDALK